MDSGFLLENAVLWFDINSISPTSVGPRFLSVIISRLSALLTLSISGHLKSIRTIEDQYSRKSQRDHILDRPDSYIGSIEASTEVLIFRFQFFYSVCFLIF